MNYLIMNPAIGIGGAQRVALNTAHFLKKSGHRAIIFTTILEKDNLPAKFRKLNFFVSKNIILKRGGQTSRYQNINNPFLLLFRLIKIRREMDALIVREKIDAVIIYQQPFNWVASFYHRCPVIWYCHEPISLWKSSNINYFPLRIEEPTIAQSIFERIYEHIDRFIVNRGISKILTSSNLTKKLIFNIYKKSAVVINPPVEDEWLGGKARSWVDPFTIIQVGKFNYEKNHIFTLEVFKLFLGIHPKSKLVFVGDGEYKKMIENKINEWGIRSSVIIKGSISDLEVRRLYQTASVMIYPSTFQTWGLAPLEALASGVLPVVSNKCGVAELISKEKIGFVINLQASEALKQLRYIYKHHNEVKNMVKKGQQYLKEYLTYELFVKKLHEEIR